MATPYTALNHEQASTHMPSPWKLAGILEAKRACHNEETHFPGDIHQ